MSEVKSIFKSKTIWGVLLMVIGSVFGFNIPEGVDQEIANIATTVIEAVGAALAVWGRIKADKKLTVTGK